MNTNKLCVGVLARQSAPQLTAMALALSMAFPASAITLNWTGSVDAKLSTLDNWSENVAPLANDTLSFASLAGTYSLDNDIAATLHKLDFLGGNYVLSGAALTLTPFRNGSGYSEWIDTNVISVAAGTQTINNSIALQPLVINRVLSQETISQYGIIVGSNGTLNLNGNVTSTGSLTISNAGTVNTTGALNVGSLTLSGTGQIVLKDNGSLNLSSANKLATVSNGATLSLGNVALAKDNRLGSANLAIGSASTLELVGNAASAVTEQAGALTVRGTGYNSTSPSAVIKVNGNGQSAVLSFSKLEFGVNNSLVREAGGRVDFQSNGTLGGNERIIFTQAPVSVDGLLGRATVNGYEFASYDSSVVGGNQRGVVAATNRTSLLGGVAGDNVFLNGTNESVSGAVSMNSLAVNNALAQGAGTITVGSGQVMFNGTNSIAPSLDFAARQGQIDIRSGQTTLQGGIKGSNGAVISGVGGLTLSGVSNLTGTLQLNNQALTLTLSANNALQSASISLGYDPVSIYQTGATLNIGNTTQTVTSLSGTGRIVGTGSITATTGGIAALGDIAAQLNAVNGTVDLRYGNLTGAISASAIKLENVTSTNSATLAATGRIDATASTLGSSISGAASLNAYAGYNNGIRGVDLTAQSTHTGATHVGYELGTNGSWNGGYGMLTLRGDGALIDTPTVSVHSRSALNLHYDTPDIATATNRINDNAAVSLRSATLSLVEANGASGQTIEKIGALSILESSNLKLTGNVGLLAGSLAVASGNRLIVDLGSSGSVKFVNAPVATDGAVIDRVLANRMVTTATVTNGILPVWATYSTINGVQTEHAVGALATAGTGIVRVTDAFNQPTESNVSVGAAIFDTSNAITGSGTLTTTKGLAFFQDNTLSIKNVVTGSNSLLSNAGTNLISSNFTGTNLEKLGQGSITLSGVSSFSQGVTVTEGRLVVTGTLNANVSGGGMFVIKDSGKVDGNIDTVTLDHASFTNANGRYVSSVNVAAGSSFTNTVETSGYYAAGAGSINVHGGTASNTGKAYSIHVLAGSASNTGTVNTVDVDGGTVTNSGSGHIKHDIDLTEGSIVNSGKIGTAATVGVSASGSSIVIWNRETGSALSNSGTITTGYVINEGVINNSGTFELLAYGTYRDYGIGSYNQTSGKTTIDGIFDGDMNLAGGILNGWGAITGTVTVANGAQILPGHSPGVLEVQNLILKSGSILELDISSANSDKLIIHGLLDAQLGSKITFNILDATQVIDLDVNDYFTFDAQPNANLFANVSFLAQDTSGGIYTLGLNENGTVASVQSVPEPETYAMMLVGLGLVGGMAARRQRRAFTA